MSACLSAKALTRALAELGTPGELAHLATCADCTARYRGLTDEMATIARVLGATPEPYTRAAPTARRRVAAVAALSAVAVTALLLIEVGLWKAVRPELDQPQQVATALADISSALFSVNGEPEQRGTILGQDDAFDAGCDEASPLDDIECSDAVPGAEERTDLLDAEATGDSAAGRPSHDQGA